MNAAKNLWYDHGAGRGGTIIDLAMELEGLSGPGEAIRSISLSHPPHFPAVTVPSRTYAVRSAAGAAMRATEIIWAGPVASRDLVAYLEKERGIPAGTAAEYLVEVRYRSPDGRQRRSL